MSIEGSRNVNQPMPNTVGATVNQPQIGGEQVQPGGFGAIRRALSDIGHKIQDFFSGIATKFENWQEGRAIKQATSKANQAAESLVSGLANPGSRPDTTAQLDALMKYSARVNPDDPDGFARGLIKDKILELPQDQRSGVIDKDFKTLGNDLKAINHQRIDQLVDMETKLSVNGLVDEISDGKALKQSSDQKIDKVTGLMTQGAKDARISDLRDLTGGLFNIADDGTISGSITNAPAPFNGGPSNPIKALESHGQGRLDSIQTKQNTLHDVGKHKILSSAAGDWHRMNIVLNNNGSSYSTKLQGDTSLIPKKLETSVDKFNELTGSDKATLVLSSVLHQYDLREMVHNFPLPNGEQLDLRPIQKGYDQAEVRLPNGQTQVFDNPGQIGEAVFNVSRTPNGDFKIDVNWDYLSIAVRTNPDNNTKVDPSNPMHGAMTDQDSAKVPNCIKVNMSTSFVVSGVDANNGKLVIQPGGTFQHTFSGTVG